MIVGFWGFPLFHFPRKNDNAGEADDGLFIRKNPSNLLKKH